MHCCVLSERNRLFYGLVLQHPLRELKSRQTDNTILPQTFLSWTAMWKIATALILFLPLCLDNTYPLCSTLYSETEHTHALLSHSLLFNKGLTTRVVTNRCDLFIGLLIKHSMVGWTRNVSPSLWLWDPTGLQHRVLPRNESWEKTHCVLYEEGTEESQHFWRALPVLALIFR